MRAETRGKFKLSMNVERLFGYELHLLDLN